MGEPPRVTDTRETPDAVRECFPELEPEPVRTIPPGPGREAKDVVRLLLSACTGDVFAEPAPDVGDVRDVTDAVLVRGGSSPKVESARVLAGLLLIRLDGLFGAEMVRARRPPLVGEASVLVLGRAVIDVVRLRGGGLSTLPAGADAVTVTL